MVGRERCQCLNTDTGSRRRALWCTRKGLFVRCAVHESIHVEEASDSVIQRPPGSHASATRPAGGASRRCSLWPGRRSIGPAASGGSSRAPRRTERGAPFRSRRRSGSSSNAGTNTPAAASRPRDGSSRGYSTERANRSRASRSPGGQRAERRGSRGGSCMLRRTAVRNLERGGVFRSVAMKMTGHKTEPVYRGYGIVSESDGREAGEAGCPPLARGVASHRQVGIPGHAWADNGPDGWRVGTWAEVVWPAWTHRTPCRGLQKAVGSWARPNTVLGSCLK